MNNAGPSVYVLGWLYPQDENQVTVGVYSSLQKAKNAATEDDGSTSLEWRREGPVISGYPSQSRHAMYRVEHWEIT